ncbi:MAG: hypothetical protein L6R30_25915 [Thermoanaerobaculia bacterium]|nr:hypothetical protein [Thermoanaerobaculia bacterium]
MTSESSSQDATPSTPTASTPPLTQAKTDAMRAFLQRGEVRLSTMHRIAGAFLSGAGLLVLFPVFLRDAVQNLAQVFLQGLTVPSVWNWSLLLCALIPVGLSFLVPISSLWFLLRDLVHFYFLPHKLQFWPGPPPRDSDVPKEPMHPRFSITGLSAHVIGDAGIIASVAEAQKNSNLVNFVLPYSDRDTKHISDLIVETGGKVLPPGRGRTERTYAKDNITNWDKFNAVLGLAGVTDLSLVQEVAKLEASLARHAIALRRLVLRYMKALLAFTWTMLATFVATSLTAAGTGWVIQTRYLVLLVLYLVWALAVYSAVKLPIRWIVAVGDPGRELLRDQELLHFEKFVRFIALVAGLFAAVGIAIYLALPQ